MTLPDNATDGRPKPPFVSPIITTLAAAVTMAVAMFLGCRLGDTGLSARLLLSLSSGATIAFLMHRLRPQRTFTTTHARLRLPLADALDSMSELILVIDRDGRILLSNSAFQAALGKNEEQLYLCPAEALDWVIDAEHPITLFPWQSAIQDKCCQTGTVLGLRTTDNSVRKYLINATTIPTEKRRTSVALVTLNDVTDLETRKGELVSMLQALEKSRDEVRQQNSELEAMAKKDPLTGCTNRRGFFGCFETMWKRAIRYQRDIACLMIDVDHFKSINDTFGHSKGDEVLVGLAKILHLTFRDTDLVCRYGGEEFCVVLPEQTTESAVMAAERFRTALKEYDFKGLQVTASIGLTSRDANCASFDEMIDQADQALYVAKRNGRDCVMTWERAQKIVHHSEEHRSHRTSHGNPPHDCQPTARDATRPATAISESVNESIPTQAVSALVSALAFRDPMTAEHSSRVAALCVAIGQGMMSDRELRVMETAALLHDIGKIGVPDSILLKPGPLSEEEWTIMRQQERIGVEIVRSAFASDQLANLLKTHHAHFGGNTLKPGLPSGRDIPLSARIISVCDAFDAMTTDRVYRPGISNEEAFRELRSCAGKQFDPVLVDRLVTFVRETGSKKGIESNSRKYQSALQLGVQIEQIAEALEEFDVEGIRAISARLAETANYLGAEEIANVAQELVESIAASSELESILHLTHELLDTCHQSRHDIVMTTGAL